MEYLLRLSVHDIVDVLMRRGHLDTRVFNQASMQEGTRLHSLYQSEQGSSYLSEYGLDYTFHYEEFTFEVSGKADGVIFSPAGEVTVEEIKTTVADLNEFFKDHGQWHLAQAMVYAYIIAKQENKDRVTIVLTYLKQQNYRISKKVTNTYTMEELSQFMDDLLMRYALYRRKVERFITERDESIPLLSFPFTQFRQGQKEMMDFVNEAINEKKQVYIEAPTGIGKTISVLYPMVKTFKRGHTDKVVYLTSKNSIKAIAMNALKLLKEQGSKVKGIEFTSKENLCFNDKKGHCNPEECPFARHYYDKLYDTIFDALEQYDIFDRENIERLAYVNTMCPFQLQLDLSNYCDTLICDYNYVFDYHDRLGLTEGKFSNKKALLCVDECHNLPDRVREMYSLTVSLKEFQDALSLCGSVEFQALKSDIKSCIKDLKNIEITPLEEKKDVSLLKAVPEDLVQDLYEVITDCKSIIKKHTLLVTDPLLEFYYNMGNLYYLATLVNDEKTNPLFLCYCNIDEKQEFESLRIYCMDSRDLIREGASFFDATIFFSATLSPREYYIDLLGGNKDEENTQLILPSPFNEEHRRVFIENTLSLKYKDRDFTLVKVFDLIRTAISQKKGNYFVFCPSFEYLDRIYDFFRQYPEEDCHIIPQGHYMKEKDRDMFLANFSEQSETTNVGLLVLGGIFSEGIDLIGDRLIGAIIISVGLPQISFERDKIKEYYDGDDKENRKGFHYAYTYPGINRILQAAGRVIRSDEDKGFLMFIDARLRQSNYISIFQVIYPDAIRIISHSQLKTQLRLFWKENES